MAFFKFRLPGSKAETRASSTGPVESIEGLRRRARHRLIGAAVLVLVAVIGFPLVFDTQPRPVAVDVAIQIPDRNKVKPLSVASAPADAAPAAVPPAAPAPVRAASTPARPGYAPQHRNSAAAPTSDAVMVEDFRLIASLGFNFVRIPLDYRGWIQTEDEYCRFYAALSDRGYRLVSTPEQYAEVTYFPNYYPKIREASPGPALRR